MNDTLAIVLACMMLMITLWGITGVIGDTVTHRELAKIEASRGCK